MNKMVFPLFLSLFFHSSLTRGDSWSAVGKPKVFLNQEGVRLVIVSLPPQAGHSRAVVMIEGTHTDIDAVPMLHSVKESGSRAEFIRKIDGKDFVTISASGSWDGSRELTVAVPQRPNGVPVYFVPKEVDKVEGQKIINQMLFRRDDTNADKKRLADTDNESIKSCLNETNRSCKATLTLAPPAAKSVEEVGQKLDIGRACCSVLLAINQLCQDDLGRKAVGKQIRSIECAIGPEVALRLSKDRLTFTTAVDAPGQQQLAKEWLESKL